MNELQASNIEEIKQQLAELRRTTNTACERRRIRVSVFLPVYSRDIS